MKRNNIKKLMFPPIDHISKIRIDNESCKFITFAENALEITNIIIANLDNFPTLQNIVNWDKMTGNEKVKYLTISDITGGVGGNVLNFALYFKKVNAIEILPTRFNFLVNNVKMYNLHTKVHFFNGDSYKLLVENKLVQDIIFFDPPWGGVGYKNYDRIRLMFSGKTIEYICDYILTDHAKMVVLKLPTNYDYDYFETELQNYWIKKVTLKRMTIVLLRNF